MNKMVMGGDGDSDTGSLCGQKEKILVSVRLRPVNEKERARNDVCDWECINNSTIIFKSTIPERAMFPSAYTFDRVFGSECQTRQVYEDSAKEVALAVVNGINASIFAYGQTSSGKTYTMSGVTEYGVADIFDYIEKHPDREYVLKFSAMEIYNEAVRDLLSADCTPLRLLDDPERGTVVERLTEEILTDWNHFLELLAVCQAQRHIGETSLNEMSSRSHQIVRLTIESSSKEFLGPDNPSSLAACVNFVDLAGSERASQTMAAGARLKEGCHINRSLLTLGTVIRKLSKGRSGHVPYRDSKLTRILHNSLGGNARTAIICTMSPARSHVEQSRNTLLFASCAKEVTTNAQVNVVMSDKALVKQLQRELARMERELRSFGSSSTSSDSNALLREKELQIEKMNKEIKELNDQLYLAQSRIQDLQRSTGENGESIKEEYSTLGFPDKSNPIILNSDNAARKIFHRNNSSLDFGENPEDNFLLDGLSPRLSIGTPNSKYIAADPIPGWDNPSPPKVVEDITQDACKEVQCIEVEESLAHDRDEIEKKEDVLSSPERREGEMGEIGTEVTYDSLRNKIQEMQKTIDSLVNVYPAVERSPSSSDADSSSLTSYKISRTRSSKSVLMGVAPYTTPEGSEIGFLGNLDSFRQRNASITENNHRKDSQASFQTDVSDLTDVVSPRKEFVSEQNKMEDVLLKQADEQVSEQKSDEPNQNNAREATTQEKSQVVSEFQLSDWEFEFKMRRAKIIELWDICYVPLVHRSYFFLLFKGDPSDVVYVEVELRRLSFLKTSISGGSHSSVLSIDSIKALNKEREMLSRRIPKKFSRKERENLYSKWNIDLNSKQRSLQLTRMLWMDTKDMFHIKESAKLVGKLVGIFENQMPKEMFGLTFSPQPHVSSRRSFGWSSSMSSLSVVSLS